MKPENIKEIKIGFSCYKEWPKMQGNDYTRHCKSCKKSVFNFSNSTNQEVIEFLSKRSGESNCGKFNQSQIESINHQLQASDYSSILKPFILATTMATMIACGTSKKVCETVQQHRKSKVEIISEVNNPDTINKIFIHGQILDEAKVPIIGVHFVIDESEIGSITDLDGKFKLEVAKNEITANTTSIRHPGYEPLQIPLIDIKNKEIKIELIESFVLLGEVVLVHHSKRNRFWNRIKTIFK